MAVSPAAPAGPIPADPDGPPPALNLRLNRWSAVASAISTGAIQPFIAVLAIRLGATDAQLGTLSSLPNLLSIPAVLLGGWILVRARRKRLGVAGAVLLSRLAFLAVAAVPWAPPPMRVAALIATWALAMGPDAAGRTGLSSLIADLFPSVHRALALADRNVAATAAGLAAGIATGLLLDRLPFPGGYQAMFVLACIAGVVEAALIAQMREPAAPAVAAPVGGGAARWLRTLRNGPYTRYTLAVLAFHLSWQGAWPIFARYHITDLGANNTWISVLNAAAAIGSILSYPRWVRVEQQLGNRRSLMLAVAGLALLPLGNVLVPNLYWLVPVQWLAGGFSAGVVLLLMSGLLAVCPAGERPLYLAVNQALVSATGAVAPLIGGLVMAGLGTRPALLAFTAARYVMGFGAFWLLYRWERRQENMGQR